MYYVITIVMHKICKYMHSNFQKLNNKEFRDNKNIYVGNFINPLCTLMLDEIQKNKLKLTM